MRRRKKSGDDRFVTSVPGIAGYSLPMAVAGGLQPSASSIITLGRPPIVKLDTSPAVFGDVEPAESTTLFAEGDSLLPSKNKGIQRFVKVEQVLAHGGESSSMVMKMPGVIGGRNNNVDVVIYQVEKGYSASTTNLTGRLHATPIDSPSAGARRTVIIALPPDVFTGLVLTGTPDVKGVLENNVLLGGTIDSTGTVVTVDGTEPYLVLSLDGPTHWAINSTPYIDSGAAGAQYAPNTLFAVCDIPRDDVISAPGFGVTKFDLTGGQLASFYATVQSAGSIIITTLIPDMMLLVHDVATNTWLDAKLVLGAATVATPDKGTVTFIADVANNPGAPPVSRDFPVNALTLDVAALSNMDSEPHAAGSAAIYEKVYRFNILRRKQWDEWATQSAKTSNSIDENSYKTSSLYNRFGPHDPDSGRLYDAQDKVNVTGVAENGNSQDPTYVGFPTPGHFVDANVRRNIQSNYTMFMVWPGYPFLGDGGLQLISGVTVPLYTFPVIIRAANMAALRAAMTTTTLPANIREIQCTISIGESPHPVGYSTGQPALSGEFFSSLTYKAIPLMYFENYEWYIKQIDYILRGRTRSFYTPAPRGEAYFGGPAVTATNYTSNSSTSLYFGDGGWQDTGILVNDMLTARLLSLPSATTLPPLPPSGALSSAVEPIQIDITGGMLNTMSVRELSSATLARVVDTVRAAY